MGKNRWLALLLAAAMTLCMTGCHGSETGQESEPPEESPTQTAEPSAAPSVTPSAESSAEPSPSPEATMPLYDEVIRLAVLSGPTGVGAAKLLHDIDEGEHSGYDYVIAGDNNELVAGLTNPRPEYDIVTMASNMAVNLYNKTDGDVQIIALGTLGVLHILESGGGEEIQSVADLAGKTIWSAGQGANPEYILRYLLEQNELTPGEDVEIVFADASEITAKLLSGEIECAMLPVPAATAAIAKSEGSVREAIDVTDAWDELNSGSQLVMTAVVARTDFIEQNPEAVDLFLENYAASIGYVTDNVDEAAELVAGYGIAPSAAIAKLAIPQCHLTFISGSDMVSAISDYFMALYEIDPASVGGALPDDGIYYVP